MHIELIFLLLSLSVSSYAGCPNYQMRGWYDHKVLKKGVPPSGRYIDPDAPVPAPIWKDYEYSFLRRPPSITKCQLHRLHNYCVLRHNQFRAGLIPFKNGSIDVRAIEGLAPFKHAKGMNTCSNSVATGSLYRNFQMGGQCTAAHASAFVCDNDGQNSCCTRGYYAWGQWDRKRYLDYASIKIEFDKCFMMMVNEGMDSEGEQGHWKAIRSRSLEYLSCGFGFSAEGRIQMTQQFYRKLKGQIYCLKKGKYTIDACLKSGSEPESRCCTLKAGKVCTRNEILPEEACR